MRKRGAKRAPVFHQMERPDLAAMADNPFATFLLRLQHARSDDKLLEAWRDDVRQWLEAEKAEIEKKLADYNPFNLIAALALDNVAYNPETYKEVDHSGKAALVEYVALLALNGEPATGRRSIANSGIVQYLNQVITPVLMLTSIYLGMEGPACQPGTREDAFKNLRFRSIANELLVRNSGYPHLETQKLERLFLPLEADLDPLLGFKVRPLLKLIQGLNDLVQQKVDKHVKEARERFRGQPAGLMWAIDNAGDAYSFTAGEAASFSSLSEAEVPEILDFFSCEFGANDTGLFSPRHKLQRKPLIKNGQSYFYPVPGSLLWAIQPAIERKLNPAMDGSQASKQSFERLGLERGKLAEEQALVAVGRLFPGATCHRELYYKPDPTGDGKQFELDGLVAFDCNLLFLEVKAGNFTDSAKGGASRKIRADVRKLIGDAHGQAERAASYFLSQDSPEFRTREGRVVPLDKKRFTEAYCIAVTAEAMDMYQACLREVQAAELLTSGDLPWAISVGLLEVLAETSDSPGIFWHYLQERKRVGTLERMFAHDELDLYGFYLEHGLQDLQPDSFGPNTLLVVGSEHAAKFDSYYLYKQGLRKHEPPKPTKKVQLRFRALIKAIEDRGQRNYTKLIAFLMRLNRVEQRFLADQISNMRSRVQKTGKPEMKSLVSEPGRLFWVVYPAKLRENSRALLRQELEKIGADFKGCCFGLSVPSHGDLQVLQEFFRDVGALRDLGTQPVHW